MGTVRPRLPPFARRVFGVALTERTHYNLAYLLLRFPFGIAYFVLFFTGLVLGIALIPLVIGVPILVGLLGVSNHAGAIEADVATRFLAVEVAYEPTDPSELSILAYLKTIVTDLRNYLFLGYFLGQSLVGTVIFVALTIGVVVPLALVVAPLVYWVPGVRYQVVSDGFTIDFGLLTVTNSAVPIGLDATVIDTLPEALLASVLGVVILLVMVRVFNGVARALGWLTVALFDTQNR